MDWVEYAVSYCVLALPFLAGLEIMTFKNSGNRGWNDFATYWAVRTHVEVDYSVSAQPARCLGLICDGGFSLLLVVVCAV